MVSPVTEILHFKKNLLGGSTLTDGNGNVILETVSSAAGGETVIFENGETAHLTENIYGSATLDFTGVSNDIVGTASIFGAETFHQGGEYIGTMEPNFMGNGVEFTGSTSETLFTTSPDLFGGTQISFTSPFIDSNTSLEVFDIHNTFSDIDTISSQVSMLDLGSATDAIDGLDLLGLF